MRYRSFGKTGLKVSEIGFGAWGIGKALWVGAEDEESLRALRAADAVPPGGPRTLGRGGSVRRRALGLRWGGC